MKIKLSKSQWQGIGVQAGWIKTAQVINQSQYDYYRKKYPHLKDKTNEEIGAMMASDNGLSQPQQGQTGQQVQPQQGKSSRELLQAAINANKNQAEATAARQTDKSENARNNWLKAATAYRDAIQKAKAYYTDKKALEAIILPQDPANVLQDLAD